MGRADWVFVILSPFSKSHKAYQTIHKIITGTELIRFLLTTRLYFQGHRRSVLPSIFSCPYNIFELVDGFSSHLHVYMKLRKARVLISFGDLDLICKLQED